MKRVLIFLFAWTLVVFALQAQTEIDKAMFRAMYKFSYKTSPEQPTFGWVDWMYIDMGNKATMFYNRYAELKDSMTNECLKQNMPPEAIHERTKNYPVRGDAPVYCQLYSEKTTRVATRYAKGYYYEEPMIMPQWILDNKSLTLYGYTCRRATTHYLGRTWEVYYTTEIPLSYGPWKLWGLPGLIVRATDADHYFLFELDHFKRLSKPEPIIYIHREFGNKGGYTGSEYKKVSKKTFMEYERLFHKNAMAFLDFEMGDTGPTSGDPAPVAEIPYIPLEKQLSQKHIPIAYIWGLCF